MNDNSPGAQGFRTTHTWALKGRPPAPATSRVPSPRTSLIVYAHPPFDNGSCRMPNASDQMKGTPFPFARRLIPTTSPAELIDRAAVSPPPRLGRTRVPPFAYQTKLISSLHGSDGEGEQADPTDPTRSPALLDPMTTPRRLSSCSTCQAPLIRRQRTGTPELPPTIVPSPLTAYALAPPPAMSGGRVSRHCPGLHTDAKADEELRYVPTTTCAPELRPWASPSSLHPRTVKLPAAFQRTARGAVPGQNVPALSRLSLIALMTALVAVASHG